MTLCNEIAVSLKLRAKAKSMKKSKEIQDLPDWQDDLILCFLPGVKPLDNKGGSVYLKMRKRP